MESSSINLLCLIPTHPYSGSKNLSNRETHDAQTGLRKGVEGGRFRQFLTALSHNVQHDGGTTSVTPGISQLGKSVGGFAGNMGNSRSPVGSTRSAFPQAPFHHPQAAATEKGGAVMSDKAAP